MSYRRSLFWMRRDLRLRDNTALYAAAKESENVACAFVLDAHLLRGERVGPPIVQFFFDSLAELREALRAKQSDLALLEGDFATELIGFAKRIGADAVFYNTDTDPQAVARDRRVERALTDAGLAVHAFVDQVYFDANEVLAQTGKPYTVYTPYRRRWEALYHEHRKLPVPSEKAIANTLLARTEIGETLAVPKPEAYGHTSSERYPRGGERAAHERLGEFIDEHAARYLDDRNTPSLPGTSFLSPHLRAGTIGIRTCVEAASTAKTGRVKHALASIDGWISELIWRDFYNQVLVHHPAVASQPFVEAAKRLKYRTNDVEYNAWCAGTTGYPIVDAAMIQLNTTGWMHNRLRMVVASFLTKHLFMDYRLGERYFEQHLADADLAANNGGWQWSASTGTDAAPYFRIFNPIMQGKTFDPDGTFVRAMIPALAKLPAKYIHEPWALPPLIAADLGFELGRDYPEPIVDHREARERALTSFTPVLGKKSGGPKSVKT